MVDRAKKASELSLANTILAGDYILIVQNVGTANAQTKVITSNTLLTPVLYNANSTGVSFTPNKTNGLVQTITASNNFTLNPPSNMSSGQTMTIVITQDSTGSRVMTANAYYKFASANKTLSTAPNAIDKLSILCANSTLFYVELNTGYAT